MSNNVYKAAEIRLIPTKGEAKVIKLTRTSEAIKNASGKMTKEVWQPEKGNKVLMDFGKVYVDVEAK